MEVPQQIRAGLKNTCFYFYTCAYKDRREVNHITSQKMKLH